ncbi:MAG: hypothetical protein ACLFTQ_00790 [Candidatus Aenigmatarchaeota archaeon]
MKKAQVLIMVNVVFAVIAVFFLIIFLSATGFMEQLPVVDYPELEMRFGELVVIPREASADINAFLKLSENGNSMREVIRDYLVYGEEKDLDTLEENLNKLFTMKEAVLTIGGESIENDVEVDVSEEREKVSAEASRIIALPGGKTKKITLKITQRRPEFGGGE